MRRTLVLMVLFASLIAVGCQPTPPPGPEPLPVRAVVFPAQTVMVRALTGPYWESGSRWRWCSSAPTRASPSATWRS